MASLTHFVQSFSFETKYSRMGRVKIVEDSLKNIEGVWSA